MTTPAPLPMKARGMLLRLANIVNRYSDQKLQAELMEAQAQVEEGDETKRLWMTILEAETENRS